MCECVEGAKVRARNVQDCDMLTNGNYSIDTRASVDQSEARKAKSYLKLSHIRTVMGLLGCEELAQMPLPT